MNDLHKVRTHMRNILANDRLSKALKTRVLSGVDKDIEKGDKILIHRDNPGKLVGSYYVIDVYHKLVQIKRNGKLSVMYIDRCKRWNKQEQNENIADKSINPAEVELQEDTNNRQ